MKIQTGNGFQQVWDRVATESPFEVPKGLGPVFARYRDELVRWNGKINLIRFKDDRELAARHFLDSLACLSVLPPGARVADVGSGAGFPGMVLAIARPDLRVTLIESTQKKANFLRHLRRELNIENVEIHDGRAEDVERNEVGFVTGRAAAKPDAFLVTAKALVKPGGRVLIWTTPESAAALESQGIEPFLLYRLPGDDKDRSIAIIPA